ncbi:MAG TPA: hypothetical protein VD998_02140 [Verrucomicrobiae bacterium]|nr:hypothetical protein [Verrucomicrobiae bacterium]
MKQFAIVLMLLPLIACDKFEAPLSPSSPTAGGGTVTELHVHFVRPCRAGEAPSPPTPNVIPTCVRVAANEYGVVLKGPGNDLRNAIILQRDLRADESWSGAIIYLEEYTIPPPLLIATSVPFVTGQTDRVSFNRVTSNGSVDISFWFEPGGNFTPQQKKELRQPFRLDSTRVTTFGIESDCRVQQSGQVYHLRCSTVPK